MSHINNYSQTEKMLRKVELKQRNEKRGVEWML